MERSARASTTGVAGVGLSATLRLENIVKELDDPKMVNMLNTMLSSITFDEYGKNPDLHNAQKVRPWLSPMAWAYYAAYDAIVGAALLQIHALKLGTDPQQMLDQKKVDSVIDLAFQGTDVKLTPVSHHVFPQLLDFLESLTLQELQNTIKGMYADQETAERAKRMMQVTSELNEDTAKATKELSQKT